MATKDFATAAVILANEGGITTPSLDELVGAAREAGAGPIVVVVPRGYTAPAGGRTVHVPLRSTRISAIRAGMAQLANTPSRFAMLMPRTLASVDAGSMRLLVEQIAAEPGALIARDGASLDDSPVIVARDAWLELLTLGEQGMDAVAGRRGVLRV